MITIEIENPTEIAAKESFWARTFGSLAPNLIRRKVEERVVAGLEEVFEGQGIRATITIHPAPAAPTSAEEPWKT